MRKWIARGAVGLTVLVSGAGAAFMVLADMGERKLTRRIDVAVTPVAFRSDAASIERGALPVQLARLRRLPRQRRRRPRRRRRRQGHARALARHHAGAERRRRRLHAGRLGAHGAPRRQARRPAGDDHAERGIQPLRRRRPRRGRRLRAPAAAPATGAKAEIRLPMPVKALYAAGVVQGREREDRSLAAAGAAGARRHHAGARRLRRQRLHRLPRREARRRQDPGRAARLAAGGQAHAGRRQRARSLSDAPSSSWRC